MTNVIHGICPQRETGVWNKIIFWFLFSVLGRSINLATSCYHYFIVSHPILMLDSCLLAYMFASIYILKIGKLLDVLARLEKNGVNEE